MDKCIICNKRITPEDIENNNIVFLRSSHSWVHQGKCAIEFKRQYDILKRIQEENNEN